MKRLKLSDGGYTLVDDEDYINLSKWKWRKNSQGYVRRSIPNGEFLHRLLLNAPKDKLVDHINRNPLDNRRSNLRLCTPSYNNINQKLKANNKTGFRGVSWHNLGQKYIVSINYNNKKTHLGSFADISEAIGVRMTAELEIFGELTNG